ncbi:unnamed protein product [Closterium sp. NIES-53]
MRASLLFPLTPPSPPLPLPHPPAHVLDLGSHQSRRASSRLRARVGARRGRETLSVALPPPPVPAPSPPSSQRVCWIWAVMSVGLLAMIFTIVWTQASSEQQAEREGQCGEWAAFIESHFNSTQANTRALAEFVHAYYIDGYVYHMSGWVCPLRHKVSHVYHSFFRPSKFLKFSSSALHARPVAACELPPSSPHALIHPSAHPPTRPTQPPQPPIHPPLALSTAASCLHSFPLLPFLPHSASFRFPFHPLPAPSTPVLQTKLPQPPSSKPNFPNPRSPNFPIPRSPNFPIPRSPNFPNPPCSCGLCSSSQQHGSPPSRSIEQRLQGCLIAVSGDFSCRSPSLPHHTHCTHPSPALPFPVVAYALRVNSSALRRHVEQQLQGCLIAVIGNFPSTRSPSHPAVVGYALRVNSTALRRHVEQRLQGCLIAVSAEFSCRPPGLPLYVPLLLGTSRNEGQSVRRLPRNRTAAGADLLSDPTLAAMIRVADMGRSSAMSPRLPSPLPITSHPSPLPCPLSPSDPTLAATIRAADIGHNPMLAAMIRAADTGRSGAMSVPMESPASPFHMVAQAFPVYNAHDHGHVFVHVPGAASSAANSAGSSSSSSSSRNDNSSSIPTNSPDALAPTAAPHTGIDPSAPQSFEPDSLDALTKPHGFFIAAYSFHTLRLAPNFDQLKALPLRTFLVDVTNESSPALLFGPEGTEGMTGKQVGVWAAVAHKRRVVHAGALDVRAPHGQARNRHAVRGCRSGRAPILPPPHPLTSRALPSPPNQTRLFLPPQPPSVPSLRPEANAKPSPPFVWMVVSFIILAISVLVLWMSVHLMAKLETDTLRVESAQAQLATAKVAAEAASRAKSDFLTTMSHEIRTPMNGVIGMLNLLMETPLDGTQQDYAETACSSGRALCALINDILDLSKIEAEKLHLERIPLNLRAELDDVLSLFVESAEEKRSVELAAFVADDVPETLVGDPLRIRQILMNLIGNAFKFTSTGHIFLVIRLALADDTFHSLASSASSSLHHYRQHQHHLQHHSHQQQQHHHSHSHHGYHRSHNSDPDRHWKSMLEELSVSFHHHSHHHHSHHHRRHASKEEDKSGKAAPRAPEEVPAAAAALTLSGRPAVHTWCSWEAMGGTVDLSTVGTGTITTSIGTWTGSGTGTGTSTGSGTAYHSCQQHGMPNHTCSSNAQTYPVCAGTFETSQKPLQGAAEISPAYPVCAGQAVRLLVAVEDTGEGIPIGAQRCMFRPYSQAHASTTRLHGGTGIGLSICKRRMFRPYSQAHASTTRLHGGTGIGLSICKVRVASCSLDFLVALTLDLPCCPVFCLSHLEICLRLTCSSLVPHASTQFPGSHPSAVPIPSHPAHNACTGQHASLSLCYAHCVSPEGTSLCPPLSVVRPCSSLFPLPLAASRVAHGRQPCLHQRARCQHHLPLLHQLSYLLPCFLSLCSPSPLLHALYSVQRLVSLMGGSIAFTSEPGVGTTFYFDITLHTPPTDTPSTPPPCCPLPFPPSSAHSCPAPCPPPPPLAPSMPMLPRTISPAASGPSFTPAAPAAACSAAAGGAGGTVAGSEMGVCVVSGGGGGRAAEGWEGVLVVSVDDRPVRHAVTLSLLRRLGICTLPCPSFHLLPHLLAQHHYGLPPAAAAARESDVASTAAPTGAPAAAAAAAAAAAGGGGGVAASVTAAGATKRKKTFSLGRGGTPEDSPSFSLVPPLPRAEASPDSMSISLIPLLPTSKKTRSQPLEAPQKKTRSQSLIPLLPDSKKTRSQPLLRFAPHHWRHRSSTAALDPPTAHHRTATHPPSLIPSLLAAQPPASSSLPPAPTATSALAPSPSIPPAPTAPTASAAAIPSAAGPSPTAASSSSMPPRLASLPRSISASAATAPPSAATTALRAAAWASATCLSPSIAPPGSSSLGASPAKKACVPRSLSASPCSADVGPAADAALTAVLRGASGLEDSPSAGLVRNPICRFFADHPQEQQQQQHQKQSHHHQQQQKHCSHPSLLPSYPSPPPLQPSSSLDLSSNPAHHSKHLPPTSSLARTSSLSTKKERLHASTSSFSPSLSCTPSLSHNDLPSLRKAFQKQAERAYAEGACSPSLSLDPPSSPALSLDPPSGPLVCTFDRLPEPPLGTQSLPSYPPRVPSLSSLHAPSLSPTPASSLHVCNPTGTGSAASKHARASSVSGVGPPRLSPLGECVPGRMGCSLHGASNFGCATRDGVVVEGWQSMHSMQSTQSMRPRHSRQSSLMRTVSGKVVSVSMEGPRIESKASLLLQCLAEAQVQHQQQQQMGEEEEEEEPQQEIEAEQQKQEQQQEEQQQQQQKHEQQEQQPQRVVPRSRVVAVVVEEEMMNRCRLHVDQLLALVSPHLSPLEQQQRQQQEEEEEERQQQQQVSGEQHHEQWQQRRQTQGGGRERPALVLLHGWVSLAPDLVQPSAAPGTNTKDIPASTANNSNNSSNHNHISNYNHSTPACSRTASSSSETQVVSRFGAPATPAASPSPVTTVPYLLSLGFDAVVRKPLRRNTVAAALLPLFLPHPPESGQLHSPHVSSHGFDADPGRGLEMDSAYSSEPQKLRGLQVEFGVCDYMEGDCSEGGSREDGSKGGERREGESKDGGNREEEGKEGESREGANGEGESRERCGRESRDRGLWKLLSPLDAGTRREQRKGRACEITPASPHLTSSASSHLKTPHFTSSASSRLKTPHLTSSAAAAAAAADSSAASGSRNSGGVTDVAVVAAPPASVPLPAAAAAAAAAAATPLPPPPTAAATPTAAAQDPATVGEGQGMLEPTQEPATVGERLSVLWGRRVMVVDDNLINRKVASKLLERHGAQVTAVDGGAKALVALAPPHPYDLVFMDLQMPGMDGLEATRRIRARERAQGGGHVAIIALTADVIAGTRHHCFAVGMDDYLSKPLHDAPLSHAVWRCLVANT